MKDFIRNIVPLTNSKSNIVFSNKKHHAVKKMEIQNDFSSKATSLNRFLLNTEHKNTPSLKYSELPKHTATPKLNPISRKLKRKFTAEKVLDLHGLTLADAQNQILISFARFQQEGIKNVLLITGGSSSRKSKIRLSLQGWLHETMLSNYVSSCTSAMPKHGGEGAFYVTLKRMN
jgi:DNA-nicking Smr family endonuclease